MLSAIIFLPLIGAIIILFGLNDPKKVRAWAVLIGFLELLLGFLCFYLFQTDDINKVGNMEFVAYKDWIPLLNIQYHLGVDGLSVPLVLLTALLGFCAIVASLGVEMRVKEYFIWLLILQSAVMGVFISLDFVLFFIFWELELLPMYFLISIWGSGRKDYSAMKFVIFTLTGSAFMLVAILGLYFSTGTFSFVELSGAVSEAKLIMPAGLMFGFLFLAFAIKLPVWPLHTWLPDAHTDAPTAVSVMLAGVLLKMGGYGMIRLAIGIFPGEAQKWSWAIAVIAVISVLYGAVCTIRQTDLKRLVAFSSVSHMGYVLLGMSSVVGVGGSVSSVGLTGAAMQMFTHGTITGLLFLVVGLIYDKAHTRHIPDLGGLASNMPFVAAAFLVAGLASLGLPGTSGFIAELLVFLGTFEVWPWITGLSVFAIVLTSGYILWMIQRVFFGPAISRLDQVGDATIVQAVPLVILIVSIMVVGLYPSIISDVFKLGLAPIMESLQTGARS